MTQKIKALSIKLKTIRSILIRYHNFDITHTKFCGYCWFLKASRTWLFPPKTVPVVKDWIKNKSGWDKEEIKLILLNPDWAFGPAGNSLFVESKLGYMPDNVTKHYERRKEEWIARGKKLILETAEN